ncbi:Retrovirus-related Pol polyprotein from transposon RE1 [Sesamum angolense]|uniref:Retrovirus-related Pol polyprotein from transposon RE1 n=1 Tax=Sesamum angolense TaxID=2727404 RepID=A0AAE1X780_9LAMI|nr:Retrovirus-related Pol polyprotein from transposon RE1 [Sesamum angolense]
MALTLLYLAPDLQTRRTIGTGHERGGLYFLDTTPPVDARALSASVSPLQWHSRLGHPSLPTLQKILPIDSARLECESCELERKHRHLLDVARTIMTHMHVPKSYWGDVVLTACYLINRMPSTVLNGDTPYSCLFPDKLLFGIAPRVFGCVCFVHIHSPSLDKLSPRSVKCIFLGYSRIQKGYRCYDPQSRKSFTFADVTFFEFTHFYSPQSSAIIPPPSVPLPVPTLSVPPHIEPPTRPLQVYSRRNRSTTLIVPPDLPPTAAPGNPSATPANDLPIALRKGKRSCIAHPLANSLSFQNLSPNYQAFSVSLSSISIPNTYCEALRHPEWKMATDDEMSALISRGTWELVEVPPNADIVACRWVFTLKFRADGTLERYKARLVAKGFTQTYGVDYFETFSPVARLNSIRVLFSLAVNLNWPMYQIDIKNAFLYGDLNETVYMEQPPGFVAQGEKQRMVCKLKKAIYGLKQSPRAWFDKFSRIIGEFGFSRCQADHSVFVQTTKTGMVVLAVYVDDILITGSDIDGIEEAKTYLQKHFVTKDLGRTRYFLGIEIAHSKHGVSLSQRKYACDLLQEAGLLGTKPVDTPMDSNPDFWNDDGNYLEDKTNQFMDKPRLVHWEAALRILKYIKTPPGKGLLFKRHGHVKIEAYSDADYAGSKDNRKSTSGYCTYVGGNLVTWRSKKQTTVARSSAKAEYRAMAHTTSEILWLKNLLKELGFMYDDPVSMHCENKAAIHIASNPVFHERTKHIEVDCHFVREAILSQKICTPFTPSSEQRADIFTKALRSKQFNFLSNKLGMIDIFAPA